MAENAGAIYYEVEARTEGLLRGAQAADRSLDGLQRSMGATDRAAASTTRAAATAGTSLQRMGSQAEGASKSTGALATSLKPLAVAIAGIVTIDALRRMQQLSESFIVLEQRITRLSASAEQGAANYRRLLAIAGETGATLQGTTRLWETLTMTLREFGGTDAQVMALTRTLQQIGTIGGTSAEEMSNALRQFGQSLSSGIVRAEEFNSVVEQMPELARQIAQGLGIPFSELRQRMLDGELTATKVLEAIQSRADEVDAEFKKLPRTTGQAFNALVTQAGAALAELDKMLGISSAIARVFDTVANATRISSGNLTGQERLNELLAERASLQQTMARYANADEATRLTMASKLAAVNAQILEIQKARVEEQKAEGKAITGKVGGDPEAKKALQTLKEQAAAAQLTGEARAKLIAVQKLGKNATAEERAEAERLAVTVYRSAEAEKARTKATSDAEGAAKKAATEAKRLAKERADAERANVEVVQDLQEQIIQAGMAGADLAARQAELSLNQWATPEQIAQVRNLAMALTELEQRKANQQLLAQMDPITGQQIGFQTELENLRKLNEAKLLEDGRYLELKGQAEKAHELQMQALQEERFKQQAIGNEILMNSLDQLQQSATSAFTGLLTGASNSTDVIRELAGAILNEAVGAVVKLGIQQVKAIVMGQSAQAAATATGVAQGAALASAYAPAAVAASIASFGAAAAAGTAALATAIPTGLAMFQAGSVAGGRQYGGQTSPGGAYRINENGAPEIWQDTSGRQYMMANRAGQVVSNKEATAAGGNQGVQVHVNIIQDASRAGQVSQRTEDGSVFIDAAVADVWGDGRLGKALQAKYGLRTAPR